MLAHIREVVTEDLYSVLIDLLGAINVVLLFDVRELGSKAPPVAVVFIVSGQVILESEGNDGSLDTVIFAVLQRFIRLLIALVKAQVVLSINQSSQGFVKVIQSFHISWLSFYHY